MSQVTRMEQIEQSIMVPLYEGGYREETTTKRAWMCNDCRLVWPMKRQAEDCESRNHVTAFERVYCDGTENGKPINPRVYINKAIRRESKVDEPVVTIKKVFVGWAFDSQKREAYITSPKGNRIVVSFDHISEEIQARVRETMEQRAQMWLTCDEMKALYEVRSEEPQKDRVEEVIQSFLNNFEVVAGEKAFRAERTSMANEITDRDQSLIQWQETTGRQWRAAELCKSIYGWSVRASSGLDGFALMAGTRSGDLDGSYEAAVAWVIRWCENDPDHRYAFVRKSALAREVASA